MMEDVCLRGLVKILIVDTREKSCPLAARLTRAFRGKAILKRLLTAGIGNGNTCSGDANEH
jgi:hypothetical protein